VNRRWQIQTYKPPSVLEISGGTATRLVRVLEDIEVGLRTKVLDLVDSWARLSVSEDGRGVAGRVQGHGGWSKYDNVKNTSKLLRCHTPARVRYTFAQWV